ncbi:MAG: GlsB/YeaQ/YmgE family stress response membrane protein [bacterium]
MDWMNLIIFLVIGLVAGWLSGQVVKGRGFGLVGNLVVGVVGAVIGGMLFGKTAMMTNMGMVGTLVSALVGAIILLGVIALVKKTT